ncbi:MAG: hypothetical protein QOH61_1975 [Chloroflexota bacterium]|nr:hypothetical protein [Chloroflexota bacterium]
MTDPAATSPGLKRVGPDLGDEPRIELEREPEPWELPPAPPPPPRLHERSVEDVFSRIRGLTLPQARAFLRAYGRIPRNELVTGGWAPGVRGSNGQEVPATLEEIVSGRAALRDAALREARGNGADLDPEPIAARARGAVVDALSHGSLRGGGLEEATVAAEVAAQDAALGLGLRPWIADWRFQELTEPWARGLLDDDTEAHSFDALGVIAFALGVMALATLTVGRSGTDNNDLLAFVCVALAAVVVAIRWRARRTPAAP